MNLPLVSGVVMVAALAFGWIGFAGAMLIRRRDATSSKQVASAPLATVGILLQGVAFMLVWNVRRARVTPIIVGLPSLDAVVAVTVCALMIVSVWTIMAAIRTLGKQWALQARLVEGHELVVSGPYARVRHPIYTAIGALVFATGLALATGWAIVVALLVFALGTALRVREEERLLAAAFGASFEAYKGRVPAVVPRF